MARISGRWFAVFATVTVVVVGVLVGVLAWKLSDNNDDSDTSIVRSRRAPHVASFGESLLLQARDDTKLTIKNKQGEVTNVASMGLNMPTSESLTECDASPGNICYEWKGDRRLRISRNKHDTSDVNCYDVTWQALDCVTQILKDCYTLQKAFWFGGFEDYNQFWPMNSIQQNEAPYVNGDTWVKEYGNVQERLFVSSNGFGIYVYPEVPLYLSFNQSNDGQVCLSAKYERYPYFNPNNSLPSLRYQICQGSNVKAVHGHMTSMHVPKPRDIPAEELFRGAIWSTWAMFKGPINQSIVIQFANDIVQSGLPYSQMEIDDDWTPKYGDMDFSKEKFPDAKGMISQLTALGFVVTVWVHPFFNLDSASWMYAAKQGYLLKAVDSQVPALVAWWRGDVAFMLDVTNENAVQWYLGNLRHLQDTYNVTSFKFDAGDGNWLPHAYSTNSPIDSPDEFSRIYVDLAYRSDQDVRVQEVRTGARSQDKPIMFRMLDRQSAWGYHRAIKTVIPCALTFGVIGYPFVLPDLIGGNGVDESDPAYLERTTYPDPELYVRWVQVSTFLPFVQFSVGPWVYNSTIQNIVMNAMNIRKNYTDVIISLARESTRTGAPIVRPLWWIAPTDQEALTTDSQYLLGDDLLVAPVLEKGSRSRDVYLPAGTWRDETLGGNHVGPTWVRGYIADLDVLPYFTRV
ncbi:myogenesis-regulating glycosidase-like [Littorina saxatilis]|uniref:Uncharacterized protein n=1 Tax=Littorina saxatilis TaxID=31220 RepID=A0AAN9AW14_9CAEN